VKTRAGEPLISTWPFAGAKFSAWLVSKGSQASSLVILKSAIAVSHRTLLSSPAYNSTHKKKGIKEPSVSHITRRNTCRNVCIYMSASKVVWSMQLVASEPPRAPGCYKIVNC
jgi:hypothetical protein